MAYVTEFTAKAQDDQKPQPPDGQGWSLVNDEKESEALDLNMGSGGKYIYAWYRTSGAGDPICGIRADSSSDDAPPVHEGWTRIDLDVNMKSGGDYVWLYYAKTPGGPKMSRLKGAYGSSESSAFGDFNDGDTVHRFDLNKDSGGKYIYMGYIWQ